MIRGGRREARGRRAVMLPTVALAAIVALLLAGCGAQDTADGSPSGSPSTAVTAGTAPTTADDGTESAPAVTIPTLGTATSGPTATPTPWRSLTSTSTTTTTAPSTTLTAPTTTRITLSFSSGPDVTDPTVAAPTKVGSPPPSCYSDGSCPAAASATSSAGAVKVLNPSGSSSTVVVLDPGGDGASAVSLARLSSPSVACGGSYCLVQGSTSGLHFGTVVRATDGVITSLGGTASSASALHLHGSGASIVVAGTQRFDGYGLGPSESPLAARTWVVSGASLTSSGCSTPHLYSDPPAVSTAQRGTCSGTPKVAGYGSASAHPMVHLGGFVTPSGNIHCALPGSTLYCTAKQHSFSVKTCDQSLDTVPKDLRGLRVSLGKTGAMTYDGCLGYTLIGTPEAKISYNRLAVGDGFVCEVQESGVSCTAPSGNGFHLKRASLTRR